MLKEERVLFPAIRAIEAGKGGDFHCGSVRAPIGVMEAEHQSTDNALVSMSNLTNGFTPPLDACNSYRAAFEGLQKLKADMEEHIAKENKILFPRAIASEMR
jgi:regulator of cell morphogenesis and NO signaling